MGFVKDITYAGAIFLLLNTALRMVLSWLMPQFPLSYDLQSFYLAIVGAVQSLNVFAIIFLLVSVLVVGAVVEYSHDLKKELGL